MDTDSVFRTKGRILRVIPANSNGWFGHEARVPKYPMSVRLGALCYFRVRPLTEVHAPTSLAVVFEVD